MPDPQRILTQLDLSAEEEYQLHLERGRRALNQGNLVEAKTEIDRCLSTRPTDSGALNLRALLLFKLEEYEDSARIFRDLTERFPDEPVLRTSLGLAYLKKNDFELGAAEFERAIKLDHDYAKAHNYLGICYQNLHRYKEARDEFLLGGSRSMAAKMEELLARAEAAKREAAEPPKPTIEEVQHSVDTVMREPEPVKQTFSPLLAATFVDEAPVRQAAVSPVQRNLNDLATRADLKFGSDAPCAVSAEGVLRVRGQGFSRLRDTVMYRGQLEFRPRFKRYKGKDLKTPFGSDADPIHELVGQGVLYLKPDGLLTLVPLEDEIVYLQEDRVWAFAGDLRWENGRLPGENGADLLLVQFKGSGHIALRLKHTLRALPLSSDMPALLPADCVVGWYGEVVPRLIAMDYPGTHTPVSVVEIKGDGHVLFEMPLDQDDHA
jgi:hypothetical protein